jgi:magnesium transporter
MHRLAIAGAALTAVALVGYAVIAGVYGMNFAGSAYNMPELEWTFGYPAAMLGMTVVDLLMVPHFRHRGYV